VNERVKLIADVLKGEQRLIDCASTVASLARQATSGSSAILLLSIENYNFPEAKDA
jgi:hypothetical protein